MKKGIFIALIIAIILMIGIYIRIADFSPKKSNDEVLDHIKKLELKIDSLNKKKDSLRIVIDSTHIKIITNEKHYKERVNIIINQPSSSDSSFITDYIRLYSKQNAVSNIK